MPLAVDLVRRPNRFRRYSGGPAVAFIALGLLWVVVAVLLSVLALIAPGLDFLLFLIGWLFFGLALLGVGVGATVWKTVRRTQYPGEPDEVDSPIDASRVRSQSRLIAWLAATALFTLAIGVVLIFTWFAHGLG